MNGEVKMVEEIREVVELINELINDDSTSRNIKDSLEEVIEILSGNEDITVMIHNALLELEELTESKSMESYTRSAIFNIISILESMNGS